jgi:hypothetical protein
MLAHDLVDRPTQDVDLFTPDPFEVARLADALVVALRAEGAQVRVDRCGPGLPDSRDRGRRAIRGGGGRPRRYARSGAAVVRLGA